MFLTILAKKLQELISFAAYILNLLIIIRVMVSWFNPNQFNPLIIQLYKITEPIMRPFRNIIPPNNSGLDFSPIIAIVAINVLEKILNNVIQILFGF